MADDPVDEFGIMRLVRCHERDAYKIMLGDQHIGNLAAEDLGDQPTKPRLGGWTIRLSELPIQRGNLNGSA